MPYRQSKTETGFTLIRQYIRLIVKWPYNKDMRLVRLIAYIVEAEIKEERTENGRPMHSHSTRTDKRHAC